MSKLTLTDDIIKDLRADQDDFPDLLSEEGFDENLNKLRENKKQADEVKMSDADYRKREDRVKEKQEPFPDHAGTLRLSSEIKKDLESAYEKAEKGHKRLLGILKEHIDVVEKNNWIKLDDYQLQLTSLVKQKHGHRFYVYYHKDYFPDPGEVLQEWSELNRSTKLKYEDSIADVELVNGWCKATYEVETPQKSNDD